MIEGGLFTRDFLIEGITSTQQWLALDEAEIARIRTTARALFSKLLTIKKPSEAVTEKDLIYPLLAGEHAKSWGLSRRKAQWAIFIVWLEIWIESSKCAGERPVENGDAHVKEGLDGPSVPSHLLFFDHAF